MTKKDDVPQFARKEEEPRGDVGGVDESQVQEGVARELGAVVEQREAAQVGHNPNRGDDRRAAQVLQLEEGERGQALLLRLVGLLGNLLQDLVHVGNLRLAEI